MSSEMLHEMSCPNCSSAVGIDHSGPHAHCGACGQRILLQGHVCPNCFNYSHSERAICSQCGTPLNRICARCAATNWAGNDYCINCGAPLDILDIVDRHGSQATARRLNQQMADSQHFKEIEQLASEKRMNELMALEEARQAELKSRLQKQKEQERQLLILVFAAVALFLVVLVIYAIISSLG